MSHIIRFCVDRPLPEKRLSKRRLGRHRFYTWEPNTKLRARFLDGDMALQEKVKTNATIWNKYSSVQIVFENALDAEIRISFTADKGSWSALGTQCMNEDYRGKATMNFGWLTLGTPDIEVSQVVRHEFGHALGCVHEHQNPEAGIKWNHPAVYEYCRALNPLWNKEWVDTNIFAIYDTDQTQFTEFDPTSIMIYPIPKGLTTDGFEVGWNSELSKIDKAFIKEMTRPNG